MLTIKNQIRSNPNYVMIMVSLNSLDWEEKPEIEALKKEEMRILVIRQRKETDLRKIIQNFEMKNQD